MRIADLQLDLAEWAKSKGWWKSGRTVGDVICLMHTELSEAYEEYRNGHEPAEIYFKDGKPEGIPIELADVVIRILNFCGEYEIDLEEALRIKMEYNEKRPYRHGGKRV